MTHIECLEKMVMDTFVNQDIIYGSSIRRSFNLSGEKYTIKCRLNTSHMWSDLYDICSDRFNLETEFIIAGEVTLYCELSEYGEVSLAIRKYNEVVSYNELLTRIPNADYWLCEECKFDSFEELEKGIQDKSHQLISEYEISIELVHKYKTVMYQTWASMMGI